MNTYQSDCNVIVENIIDFDLTQTLECGQCFRFHEIAHNEYIIVAKRKVLRIKQEDNKLIFFDTTMEDYLNVWQDYFDLGRDYGSMKRWLLEKDGKLKEAIDAKYEVRILNQEFFEMLITFIISQNKQIPHIKQIVELLSQQYGEPIGNIEGTDYYSFPTAERLAEVSEQEFRDCKTGFRAPYLVDACKKVNEGFINQKELFELDSYKVMEKLLTIKGVGEKVSNCILLFGLSRREAFPIDVWVKRIMEELYFGKEVKKETIQQFAEKQFGSYGGYAQQYLFYYARDRKEKRKKEIK